MKNESKQVFHYASTGHALTKREDNDFYATDPKALEKFLDIFEEPLSKNIWEPACGMGHLSKVLQNRGYEVFSSDLFDRGFGTANKNFLEIDEKWNGDIITNPPYNLALKFVKHAITLVNEGNYVIMFLKITFLEGKERRMFYDRGYNPKYVYIFSERVSCFKDNDTNVKGNCICFAWYVWQKGYVGETILRWI